MHNLTRAAYYSIAICIMVSASAVYASDMIGILITGLQPIYEVDQLGDQYPDSYRDSFNEPSDFWDHYKTVQIPHNISGYSIMYYALNPPDAPRAYERYLLTECGDPPNTYNSWRRHSDSQVFRTCVQDPDGNDKAFYWAEQAIWNLDGLERKAHLVLAHTRRATGGNPHIRDPHPFIWDYPWDGGESPQGENTDETYTYSFVHNGTITDKYRLRDMTEELWATWHPGEIWSDIYQYKTEHQGPPAEREMVDSEAYFHWIVCNIKLAGDIEEGLRRSVIAMKEWSDQKNFIFARAVTMYAYRGLVPYDTTHALVYTAKETPPFLAVASADDGDDIVIDGNTESIQNHQMVELDIRNWVKPYDSFDEPRYRAVPYYCDFEDSRYSSLNSSWYLSTYDDDVEYGSITVEGNETNRYLRLCGSAGHLTQNEASLHLDLSGEEGVMMEFTYIPFQGPPALKGPAPASKLQLDPDGVYFSDDGGQTYTLVYEMTGVYGVQQDVELDVDDLCSLHGLEHSSTFIVKFALNDNDPVYNNSIRIDNIALTSDRGNAGNDGIITEFCVMPAPGEFIEIYNPTSVEIDLSDHYITDATNSVADEYYYNTVLQDGSGGAAGPGNNGDFNARFPDGASIQPGTYQTIAFSNTDFNSTYGFDATYELQSTDPNVPDMRPAESGSIDSNAGLADDGEALIMYHRDGNADLVQDVDYVVWGDKAEAIDKTGIRIDGIDADSDSTSYLDDTSISLQTVVNADNDSDPEPHDSTLSAQRVGVIECGETSPGNGATGYDETSEDMSYSAGCWAANATPSPGVSPGAPTILEVVLAPPCPPESLDTVTIAARVTDDTGLDSVFAFYTVDGGTEMPLNMTWLIGDWYGATIPAQATGSLVELRVRANDNEGKSSLSPRTYGYFVGTVPIATVRESDAGGRALYTGYGARVAGVASVGTGVFRPLGDGVDFFVQDATAGIHVFDLAVDDTVAAGDSLIIAGLINQSNGVIEITSCDEGSFITLTGTGSPPAAVRVSLPIGELGEYYECQLIEMPYLSNIDSVGSWPGSGQDADVLFTDTSESLYLRIDKDTDIPGSAEPSWPQDVTGICIQNDGSIPYDGDYLLMPRSLSDFSGRSGLKIQKTSGAPMVFSLAQNHPNPFSSATTIRYTLPKSCEARLDIYNVLGQRVATIVNERQAPGHKAVQWNGKNTHGNRVAGGVYFYRLQAGDFVKAKKMVLID